MAYSFEEDFASGIPSGFASNGGYGGITATWNAAQQAADLVFDERQNFWKIMAAQQASDFWFEFDAEVLAFTYSSVCFGMWLWDGIGSFEGHRLIVWNGSWWHSYWNNSVTQFDLIEYSPAPWAAIGARRTIRLDVKRSPQGIWQFRVMVNGEVVWHDFKRWYSTFLPCVYGYGITLRLHRIAGGAGSALDDAPIPKHRLMPVALAHRILIPDHAAMVGYHHRALRPLVGTRNHYYHGDHRIAGTVKHRVKGVIADEPLRRRVLLLDAATYAVVREIWSDAATGAYSFDRIDAVPRYLVIAFDHQRQHRAVVADNLRAQPMTELLP